jgi:hypothetical protein
MSGTLPLIIRTCETYYEGRLKTNFRQDIPLQTKIISEDLSPFWNIALCSLVEVYEGIKEV